MIILRRCPVRLLFTAAPVSAAAIISLCVGQLAAQDAMTALTRAEDAYRAIQTLQATFTQSLDNPMLGQQVTTTGTIFLSPPSRFAMRFAEPAGDRVVCDGFWLWVYAPTSAPGQVLKQTVPNRGAATPNLLAQFVDRPLEHYMASYIGPDSVDGELLDAVRLVPRRDDDPFTEARIDVSRTSGLVRRLFVREKSGQRRALLFQQIQVDVAIPDDEFRFEVPEGVRVVTP